ncbi:YbhB/YbcL family Raf kinase inhibitor-like protein [Taibaiella soli]|uniref:YbhB/YbcL family Raf kinase inhibitor-like protein n=1 Tax=Taibaiella soli TaxID=1649169 RepID=A0A2W2B4I2_9BACT|nr:YbhB/YbcL family Raf kinase inhibitor-like protein [Taibaiella soli]PZF74968.1 YbhB/YbcL family Raf kinase inhibitor-like protein [Taibaiella soli]
METKTLVITSSAFINEGPMPARYTCDGDGINPPLQIEGLPANTVTLALIAEDPDAPKGIFDHWIEWNIDPIKEIKEDSNPGISGNNSAGKTGYHAPCPPAGTHRYFFYIFALDTDIDLPAGADKTALQQEMEGHIIAQGNIMGTYKRPSQNPHHDHH